MAFVLKQSDTYSWPVTFDIPVDGRLESQSFDAVFKRKGQTWIRETFKKMEDGATSDVEVAREVLAGWTGVNDGTGKDVAFNAKAVEVLLEVPAVASAVVFNFFRSITGAKEKN
tara:strand:+ start:146 stop:487 length:342 start_codon:yes stop_codon:yes gene_type:complete